MPKKNSPPTWSFEAFVVAIYFLAAGVETTGVIELIQHKCRLNVSAHTIEKELAFFQCLSELYDRGTKSWKQDGVGKYLSDVIEDPSVFEELIKWGAEEEGVVRRVSPCLLLSFFVC